MWIIFSLIVKEVHMSVIKRTEKADTELKVGNRMEEQEHAEYQVAKFVV